ncbi:hypothetical protein SprV_0501869000 [Sparganum proliferum]
MKQQHLTVDVVKPSMRPTPGLPLRSPCQSNDSAINICPIGLRLGEYLTGDLAQQQPTSKVFDISSISDMLHHLVTSNCEVASRQSQVGECETPGHVVIFAAPSKELAVEIIELLLRNKYDETENRLGHALILQLLQVYLKTCFTFNEIIYEQVKGTTTGSPISGRIAGEFTKDDDDDDEEEEEEEEENNQLELSDFLVCCKYCDGLNTTVFMEATIAV